MTEGRPLRFLATAITGWVAVRAFLLWPVIDDPTGREAIAATRPVERAAPAERRVAAGPIIDPRSPTVARLEVGMARHPFSIHRVATMERRSAMADAVAPKISAAASITAAQVDQPPPAALVAPAPSSVTAASRWSASAWGIARPSGTGGGLNASQLGGSQAGVRLAYALGEARRVSLVGRIATPLDGRGREAAIGVEWRPTRLPVRLFAERRFALGRGKGGPGVGVVAGAYEALPHRFRLEAYGQAGVIERDRTESFADGAARVTRAAAGLGPATLDLGLGAWGGAPRGAERLDLGPTLGVAVPVAGRRVRLTLDYRARVAGRARPGSGPALSLGADF